MGAIPIISTTTKTHLKGGFLCTYIYGAIGFSFSENMCGLRQAWFLYLPAVSEKYSVRYKPYVPRLRKSLNSWYNPPKMSNETGFERPLLLGLLLGPNPPSLV